MDENTKAFVEVGKKLHKDNEATLAELKKINKPSTLQQSTQENAGEILSGLLVGALDRKAEAQVAKGTNLGVGVTAKSGIDIVPGGEPSVDEKDTLFGITKAFYDKYNFGNLINSTKEVTKNLDEQKKALVLSNGMIYKGFEKQRNIFQKILDFFKKSDSSSGAALKKKKSKAVKEESLLEKLAIFLDPSKEKKSVGAGFREGTGITKLRTIMSEKLSGILKGFKGFPMMIGKGLAIPFKLIGKGLVKLGTTLLKPLGSIVKGIASLPGKILGFFGGALGMIGRLALLGGGIFALAKLTEFLRNVGPGGRKSFTEFLMSAFDTAKTVLVGLKDIIMEVVIPALGALVGAIFGVIKFLAQKGLLPGIKLGKGLAKENAAKIREEILNDPKFKEFPKHIQEDIIATTIKNAKEKRAKDFVDSYMGRNRLYNTLADIVPFSTATLPMFLTGTLLGDDPEVALKKAKKKFDLQESSDLLILDKNFGDIGRKFNKITGGIKEKLESIKDSQSSINAGVSVVNQDNSNKYVNDSVRIAYNANPFNYSVYS